MACPAVEIIEPSSYAEAAKSDNNTTIIRWMLLLLS
jgi:hypothetical protein